MTPFPVPTQRRLQDTTKAVILTKEKPSFPVPVTHTHTLFIRVGQRTISAQRQVLAEMESEMERPYPASCWRRARCQHPGGAGKCGRETGAEWNPAGWTPRCRLPPRPAGALGSLCEDGRRRTSAHGATDRDSKTWKKKAQLKTCLKGVVLHLYSHGLGLDDVNLVPVSTPHLVVHHRHAADWVVGSTQVQQVVVG